MEPAFLNPADRPAERGDRQKDTEQNDDNRRNLLSQPQLCERLLEHIQEEVHTGWCFPSVAFSAPASA
jgi:hypothetical protein